jgi:metal-dependent amidase/aminoacylase/carboxypeptidase family protein
MLPHKVHLYSTSGNSQFCNFGATFIVHHAARRLVRASFTFRGETARAGVAPWKGRDALDGVVLMDMGLAST